MFENDKKIQFVKDTLGTRQKYHEVITYHDFSDSEKNILLQAVANIHHNEIDESLIFNAYDILVSKSIENTFGRKKSTKKSPLLKYFLIIGFVIVVFYILTPNEFQGANKVEVSKRDVLKQDTAVVKFGKIRGQGFLRTKGGSIRTCAGNEVYIERNNPNGLLYLSERLQNKKDHLDYLEESLVTYKSWLNHSENMLKSHESSLRMFPSQSTYYKEQVSYYKERVIKDKQRISEQKKKISPAKKVVQEYETKVENSVKDNILKTICDAQGNYSFPKVELGKYYIRTVVQWYVGDEKQGGIISKTITIQEGENTVMLTE